MRGLGAEPGPARAGANMNQVTATAGLARRSAEIAIPGQGREDWIIALMRQHKVLHCLGLDDLRTLVRQATLLQFQERDAIFLQGDEGQSVMAVISGFVKLSSSTVGGREVLLELAGPGSVFGEMAVLNGWRRATDAHALSACQILSIQGRVFTETLAQVPAAMFGLMRVLCQRLRRTTEQVTDSVDLPAPQRVAKALINLAALHSHPVREGLRIALQLSQRELGAMTGLTRESINKHLSGWRDEGLISISDRCVTLLDVAALQQMLADPEPS